MRLAGSRQDRARARYALFVLIALSCAAQAERLPIKTYTTADGLARDHINRIVPDSKGFLWFCTSEGLSRFDGYKFTNYGIDQGLPGRVVTDFLESRNGDYWVATNEGLCRFILDPSPQTTGGGADSQKKFVVYHPGESRFARQVNTIREDREGTIWCGTDGGLYRLDQVDGQWLFSFIEIPRPVDLREVPGYLSVRAILHDRRGAVWVSANGSLFRFRSDGGAEAYATKEGLPFRNISSALLEDRDGQIWVGTGNGLYRLVPDPHPGRNVVARVYTTKDGLANNGIDSLLQSSDGRIWVATVTGLSEFLPASNQDGIVFQSYTTANGLIEKVIVALGEDRAGNLWMGTESGGAMKLAVNAFATYLEGDGLGHTRIGSIFEDRAGELCVTSSNFIHSFDSRKFAAVPLTLPRGITRLSWGWYQTMLQDRAGEWWMSTGQGLVRYPKITRLEQLARARPKAIYTTRDGLSGNLIFRIFEDSRGDIWLSTINDNQDGLTRWERATDTFHRYSFADGFAQSAPSAFCEDRAGNLWIGFYNGGLARYTGDRFTFFSDSDGVPAGVVRGLYFDSAGRLWIAASEGGAARVDDPNADRPRFDAYTTGNGLSSNQATCVTEDQWGKIYIGTGRGVDRLDPVNGNIRHYTTADGLANNFGSVSFRTRDGALWFGTLQGLSRLIPQPDRATLPPPVLISGLRIAGAPYPISELGATEIAGPELSASRNQIQIDFLALSLGAGETLRYQYKLEGANQDWSAPADQRTLNFPNLSPGAYRFLVRAVSADGTMSELPATVSFKILSPIWRRWWFLTLAGILLVTIIFALERYRSARMKEVQGALTQSTMLTVKLADKQEDLRRANRTLALEYAVTSILAESPTVSDAAPRILQAICESTGWEIGELWDADPQAGVLRCVDVWHMEMKDAAEFETHSKTITFLPGVGLPGRVLASGEPLWITDLAADTNFPRMLFAVKEGLRSGFGFPILLGNEVLGVLEFFSRETRERDQDLLDTVSSIGSQIGQLLERKRAEQKLRESESRFRTLAETASDAIITIDEQSTIIFVNPAAESVFGYAASEMLGRDLTILMPEYLRHLHRAGFTKYLETGQRHLSWEAIELPGLHKTGREIPLEISFGEFVRNDRHFFTGVARDITERKRAEEALRRSREERFIEIEQVRKRIATDLHDDIGSSLTQISILSEVAQREIARDDSSATKPLSMIANASRELVDSMSDIVWAINPQKDHLSDLTQRMRLFASDIFTGSNIKFRFDAPGADQDVRIGANVRREVFLIFKESVNNLVRHSGCTEAEIEFRVEDDWLALRVSDNGAGFDASRQSDGHGLMSMRDRARDTGGDFEVLSGNGKGTTVNLKLPFSAGPPPAS